MRRRYILALIVLIFLIISLSYVHAQENNSSLNDTNINSSDNFYADELPINQTEYNSSILINETIPINESIITENETESNQTNPINQTYECFVNEDCNDDNFSTVDLCINYSCSYTANETIYVNETEINESIINKSNESYQNETLPLMQLDRINLALIKLMTVLSPSYFLDMFTTGLQGALMQGTTKEARILMMVYQPSTRNAFSATYSANIGFFKNTIPANSTVINSYEIYPKLALTGSIIRLSISASNADNVWAKIYMPNGTIGDLILINGGYAYYVADAAGRYNVTFYANNSLGLTASARDYFDISSPSTPSTPSTHGTGAGGGMAACKYDWRCSPWGICLNKEQKRTCINIGTCTGEKDKPAETQKCAGLLFDVSIKLNSTELIEGDYPIFNVQLISKNNIQKIDVQIKYSVFDDNNKEVYTQTETRAVETELLYTKTLDELILDRGNYILKTKIIYGDQQEANAEQSFKVFKLPTDIVSAEKKPLVKKAQPSLQIYIMLFAAVLIILIEAISVNKKKKKKT